MKAVDSPRLKLNFDINHAAKTDDDCLAWLRKLKDYLVHIHLSDSRNRVHQHLIPGDGDLDWGEVKKVLEDIQYTGHCVIDIWDDYDTPDITARRSLLELKNLWGL